MGVRGRGDILNREGFTLIEVLIGGALLVGAALFVVSTIQQSNRALRASSTRLSQIDLKNEIVTMLADSAQCSARLRAPGNLPLVVGSGNLSPGPTNPPLYISDSLGGKLVQDGDTQDFLEYRVYLDRSQSLLLDALPDNPATASVMKINRYLAILRLDGNRQPASNPKLTQANQAMGAPIITAMIPILLEFDRSTGNLLRCSTTPEGIDDDTYLYAPTGVSPKRARDCMTIGGFPYPTELGLICRVPYAGAPMDNPAPQCPAGWTPVADPGSDQWWVSTSSTSGTNSFSDNGCKGTQWGSCGYVPSRNRTFGTWGAPGTTTTAPQLPNALCSLQVCRKTCGGFSITGALVGAAAGGMLGTFLGPLMGFACFKKKCHCATATFKYTYYLTASGCY